MKKLAIIGTTICCMFFAQGCAETRGDQASVGALIGGVTGALAGSHFGSGSGNAAATMLGAFIGMTIGAEIGAELDEMDRQYAQHAFEQATNVNVGKTIRWNNPQSQHHGTVKTLRDGHADSGEYCREFQTTVTIGGKTQEAYGTACRRPNGDWEIIS